MAVRIMPNGEVEGLAAVLAQRAHKISCSFIKAGGARWRRARGPALPPHRYGRG